MAAPYDGGSVDAVGREERENITLFPVPVRFQTFAEIYGGAFDLGVGVGAVGVGVAVDYCSVC